MTHIGLNAHLLASQTNSYRAAGIHSYIHEVLRHMPALSPDDWRYTAMVGGANRAAYNGVKMKRATFDTESPAKRIIWEQALQPFQLGGYDLYHAMAFVAPLVVRQPMVVTVYDLTFMRYPERLTAARRLYLRSFTENTCRRADRILAISQSTADDLTELLGIDPNKIDVTPLGYDRDVFKPLPDDTIAKFRIEKNLPERYWLYLGTLEARKNLTVLVEAYAQLPPDERPLLVLAGGKGWKIEPLFDAIEKHNLGDSIRFTGFVPDEEIALWYNSAELFLFPSVFEGFGLPVLEAMACGTPVITSDASSLPEVAEGAGLCLPPHDTTAWTEALQRVYHDAAWRTAARERGLAKVQKFSWEQTARLTIASYQRALGNS